MWPVCDSSLTCSTGFYLNRLACKCFASSHCNESELKCGDGEDLNPLEYCSCTTYAEIKALYPDGASFADVEKSVEEGIAEANKLAAESSAGLNTDAVVEVTPAAEDTATTDDTTTDTTSTDTTPTDTTGTETSDTDTTSEDSGSTDTTPADTSGEDTTGEDSTGADTTGEDSTGADTTPADTTGEDSSGTETTDEGTAGTDTTPADPTDEG